MSYARFFEPGNFEIFFGRFQHFFKFTAQTMQNHLSIILILFLWSWVDPPTQKWEKRLERLKIRFASLLRNQWRNHHESYVKWKLLIWKNAHRKFSLIQLRGGARAQIENLAFFGSRAPPNDRINLICILLEIKFCDEVNAINIFWIHPRNFFKLMISQNA